MTPAEILSMPPGPELNDLLAPLLGYRVERFTWEYDDLEKPCTIWKTADGESVNPMPLSTTWEGMRLVVEAMGKKGLAVRIDAPDMYDGNWCCAITDYRTVRRWEAIAETAPHAVCLAALLALEAEHER